MRVMVVRRVLVNDEQMQTAEPITSWVKKLGIYTFVIVMF